MAPEGERLGELAVPMVRDQEARHELEFIPQTDGQCSYAALGDQTWSLTDCAGLLSMEDRSIIEAFAYDRILNQAALSPR